MRTLVLFPTAMEAAGFAYPGVEAMVSGVGLAATAVTTTRLIHTHNVDLLILAGIAGVYPDSRFEVGDVVLVASETDADLGFFHRGGFSHLSQIDLGMDIAVPPRYDCPYLPEEPPLSLAHSNTLNAALAPHAALAGIDIENMEGAAFFHACLEGDQRFLEVRAISNEAVIDHLPWDFAGSIVSLHRGLTVLLDALEVGS
ncbi:phosphorylase family protein [Chitinolyticbacter meiyuanensis]|uniref:phosphorylase family protein n=1 Tax=Chitinolyticbacter meiyuanensis TaxID=682798 RepID=UPI0011E5B9B8|nr:purine phosphorylase [Chitinolyticbacter meiyuanensis]